MAKYLYVQLKGVEAPVKLKAETVEREGSDYVVKSAAEIGGFAADCVQGWWASGREYRRAQRIASQECRM
jgi:hypothetical protein